jgi:hypothetical protein
MSETFARHGIGGNSPPLAELLTEQYAGMLRDAEALAASADRAPKTITDDDTLGKVGRLVIQMRAIAKRAEAAHKAEKEPYLSGGRAVDSFFKAIVGRLGAATMGLEIAQGMYVSAKERAERQRQKEAEEQARAEAETNLQAALAAQAAGDAATAQRALGAAMDAETAADHAAARQAASPATLVRTYATSGNMVSSQEKWEFEITDRAAIPLEAIRSFIPTDAVEKAVKAFVRAGGRELNGVRIYETRKALNR